MSSVRFQQLLPTAGETDAGAYLDGLSLGPAPSDRPYTIANFVSSADGRATFDGRSGPLSDAGDRALFHALRERVDAVLAGTGTLAAERYGRTIPDPDGRAHRTAAGRRPEPLAVTISRRGALPLQIPLFAEPTAEIVVFSPRAPVPASTGARVHHHPLAEPRALSAAMRTLRLEHGVELLLCEGGPTLFTALLTERLIDQVFLALSPRLARSDGPAITVNRSGDGLQELQLASLLAREGTLFARYLVRS